MQSPHESASSRALELAVVADDAVTVTRLPARGALIIGRDEGCDVRIDNRSVSRRHAILHVGPSLRIQDLGSVNGTFVRDGRSPVETGGTHPLRRLSRETLEIAIGERVNLGSISIIVQRAAATRRDATAASGADRGAVVHDGAMMAIYEQAARAARSSISVLVLGETGVGKEVFARAIHDRSPRAGRPYLELNCSALPASLLEGELFGHEKGAFTGATHARAGLLESAEGGTVFLDEVGEMPREVQVKLLRVLEDGKVLRIGGRTPRKVDVRFVAATNRDLEAEIAEGTFRQDLYFRLNGVSFTIPPLRERPSEIAPLAERFLADACKKLDRAEPLHLSSDVLEHLARYAWPGNVRELRNVIERAAVLSSGDVLVPADLPSHVTGAGSFAPSKMKLAIAAPPTPPTPPTPGAAAGERQRILDALEQCAGNQTRAARLLGISLRTLVNRLARYDVPRPRARGGD